MKDLPARLRQMIQPLLPEHAFLRRSRGDATFITNAPRFSDAPLDLTALHLRCTVENGLASVSPDAAFLTAFELDQPEPEDFFSRSLLRFRGMAPCPEAVDLFAVGVRLLESADDNERALYTRRVRNLAAVCLRENLGGAYACALLLSHI